MDDQLIGGALDNYRVLSRLGEGKAGVVYMVTPLKDTAFASPGMPLALKLYKPEILKEPDQLRRIENEAKVGSQLSHPNLVRIYDYKIDMNRGEIQRAYLVMEYVDGITLHSWLSMFHPISDSLLLRILTQLGEALNCLHTNGVEQHRDIKPANILISSDFQAKLADFGVVKIDDGGPGVHTPSDKFLGTIRNASPELLMGKPVDSRTDLYSLGTVLYALLHGEEIFSETTQFAQLIEKKQHSEPIFDKSHESGAVGARLVELARRLMEAEPDKRPATAQVVLDELTGIRGLVPAGMDPLQGYVATALTGLKEDEREAIVFVSSKIAEVAKRYELYVYQPRKVTDPLLHVDVAPEEVYRLDRNRVVRADLLFILANRPSIGVGQELEITATYGKPVVLITREGTTISRMAKGSYANILAALDYSTPEDLEKKLRQCVASNIDNLRRWRRKASSHAVNVGARLAAIREAHGYTQQEVADDLGVSYSLIRAVENGQHDNVGMRVIELLCNFYGASISELATSEPPRTQLLPPDANVRRLEGIARSLNWPASDFLELRDDYLKELAASGSAASVSEEEWTNRHGALEKRKLRDMEARVKDRSGQGKLRFSN